MPVVGGAIVPHAPLLLPQLESAEVAEAAARIRSAVISLSVAADAVVILSPHAGETGVYAHSTGDLFGFGVRDADVEAPTHEGVRDALRLPIIDRAADHGVVVPLLVRRWNAPVVGVGVDGDVTLDFDIDPRVAVVASMNLSAGLSPRAPLTEVEGAAEAEAAFVASLEREISTSSIDGLIGSCGAAVMRVFARAFIGRKARVLAHEAPVGVGYVVAEVV